MSDTLKFDFQTWRSVNAGYDPGMASLIDDDGNVYKAMMFPPPPFQHPDQIAIYPSTEIKDLLVFEEPVSKLKWLHLELPESRFGGTGTIQFHDFNERLPTPDDGVSRN